MIQNRKNLNGYNPSQDDLRQMYVYHEYYSASKVALIYPGCSIYKLGGFYLNHLKETKLDKECSILTFSTAHTIAEWQLNISNYFTAWLNLHTKYNSL